MARKKNIAINVDSAMALMQEIYNDISEQKNTASLITKKMLTFMKDSEDMSVIGPVIKDQQKILTMCTEKKLSLVKLQAILLKQSDGKNNGEDGFTKIHLTDEDKLLLEKFTNESDNNDGTYK